MAFQLYLQFWKLYALAAFLEDLDSVPSTYKVLNTIYNSFSRGFDVLSWPLWASRHSCGVQKYMQTKQLYISNTALNKVKLSNFHQGHC